LQGASIQCPGSAAGGAAQALAAEGGGEGELRVSQTGLGGPPTPRVIAPLEGAHVSPTFTVVGSAVPNASVRLYVDLGLAAQTIAAADGSFALSSAMPIAVGPAIFAVSAVVDGLESARSPYTQVLIVQPVDAGSDAGPRGPRFTSTPRDNGYCGTPYRYGLSTTPAVEGTGPFSFSLQGDAIPAGLSVDPTTGALTWTPTRGQAGQWSFILRAQSAEGEALQTVTVVVECAGASNAQLGCGCGEAPAALAWLIALALRARPGRRVPTGRR
jgi:hypothetical protein